MEYKVLNIKTKEHISTTKLKLYFNILDNIEIKKINIKTIINFKLKKCLSFIIFTNV